MKAISLTEPWATLVSVREKQFETRSWSTPYRGPLAIHSSRKWPIECQDLCLDYPFAQSVRVAGHTLPSIKQNLGRILAITTIIDCIKVEFLPHQGYLLSDKEMAFGDYSPGRYAWVMGPVFRLLRPVPCKGALGIWTIPEDALEAVIKQVEEAQRGNAI